MSKRPARSAPAAPPPEPIPAPESAPPAPPDPGAPLAEGALPEGGTEGAEEAGLDAGSATTDPGEDPSEGPGEEPGEGEGRAPEDGAAEAGEPRPKKRAAERPAPPPPERLVGAVEALLLASGDVLTPERIRDLLGLASAIHVREALEQVRARWTASGLPVELQDVARGVRVVTRPEYAEYVRRLARSTADDARLSQGQLETLSIVAYRQPVARAEVERIRGVQAGEALRALLERRLVKVVGRSDQPGRPLLYGTTTRFLTAFGLHDVKDLPSAKDLARL